MHTKNDAKTSDMLMYYINTYMYDKKNYIKREKKSEITLTKEMKD